ncbi:hypothetical protein AALA22_14415 [Anaerovoracaceae bacterium 41-7]
MKSWIKKIECDEAMARKKGYIPCGKQCRTCHAAIITDLSGDRAHFPVTKQGGSRRD